MLHVINRIFNNRLAGFQENGFGDLQVIMMLTELIPRRYIVFLPRNTISISPVSNRAALSTN
ncbi:hypothetical protein C3709_22340 [Lelliottia aquatilis]|uniref:Uncharacterized protein n=1 Tax=Lelliottia aquatilis TaxID=2080838 RepID=A0ABX4ZVE2_9ENTR|nr:hypothetical protein C3Z09_21480 [Lelliottia aquatilis]POZ15195.1 hypothetical protein C3708_22400 [Lelliottia sp. 7254-16]POZ18934.1 hypothetical protein C3712_22245 [Lelliottia aquatilis]POZ20502.1 hypothetical protein C3711_22450 [Lelliottia aquatilis]POZ30573.1 hypothetical protein C3710_22215 [Lelliottia aquatilis]